MKSLLISTLNTRELGGYRCRYGVTQKNRIIRSDRICEPTEQDISYLKVNGITTVIDLRTDADVSSSPCGLTKDKGFLYHHIPIEEGGYVPSSFDDVIPSYLGIAREPNMARVMRTIAKAPMGVIFNCWAGKDRTGVTAAILLMLCGVSDSDIIENYMLTRPYSEELWNMLREFRSEEEMKIIIPNEHFINGFINGFREQFSTPERYLSDLGLSAEEIRTVIEKLCS